MAKAPTIPFLLLRRSYKVAAESGARVQKAVAMARTTTTETGSSTVNILANHHEQKQAFWMRDPKTGNWIPENHFGEIDASELREKLLPNNNKHKL